MHEDLRRRALESKKTTSRRAKNKAESAATSGTTTPTSTTPNNSLPTSRAGSRAGSRQASDDSDDENGYSSDGTQFSMGSLDAALSESVAGNGNAVTWSDELAKRIEAILTARRSRRLEEREVDLKFFVGILRHHYAADEVGPDSERLVNVLCKTAGAEDSLVEAMTALKALQVMILSEDSVPSLKVVGQMLKHTAQTSEESELQAEALFTFGIATFFGGGAGDEDVEDVMDFLLAIVESDGSSINAEDSGDVVTAALKSWALIATQINDLSDSSPDIIESLIEQLDSTDANVQVAAGEAMALLYEKSYRAVSASDDEDDSSTEIPIDETTGERATHVEAYIPYRRKDILLTKLRAIARDSSRKISKSTRRTLHSNFADIVHSVENPHLGPRYSTALDKEQTRQYGSRMAVRIDANRKMVIDKWWKLIRLEALQRVLGSGFAEHYERNEKVLEALPVLATTVKETANGKVSKRNKEKPGKRGAGKRKGAIDAF